ncbi:hypothetical protein NDU88_008485 [Pleurodeles waltl]|uniref:Uncharacterized protein n=1 Tax=Pleurodeles waltl TaxID=8319 RepID=A0AAV7NY34_PLEWA|nr:hypothetical protein NDU88_008485 [Pleurodeles waltl]
MCSEWQGRIDIDPRMYSPDEDSSSVRMRRNQKVGIQYTAQHSQDLRIWSSVSPSGSLMLWLRYQVPASQHCISLLSQARPECPAASTSIGSKQLESKQQRLRYEPPVVASSWQRAQLRLVCFGLCLCSQFQMVHLSLKILHEM